MKLWTVYSVTNLVNGRRYIGVHKTEDPNDSYMGSGKLIRYALEKYGRENFQKEVLLVTENKAEAFALEATLVTKDAIESGELYNLKEGGEGGWDHISKDVIRANGIKGAAVNGKSNGNSKLIPGAFSVHARQSGISGWSFTGKRHSTETKRRLSEKMKLVSAGTSNSQFGTRWITDGVKNAKIKKQDQIPEGWRPGRSIRMPF